MMGNSQSFLHGFFFSRKVSWILTIYFLLHHPPKFEGLNFSAGSLASHKTGFQTMLTERSQPPVSSFSTKVVNFTSQGRSSLEKICFAGEAHCSAAKGSALWSVGIRGGPGTQEPPGYSRSDPGNGGLASKIIFPFSALHVQADFFKHAVWHVSDILATAAWRHLEIFTLCEGSHQNDYWPL